MKHIKNLRIELIQKDVTKLDNNQKMYIPTEYKKLKNIYFDDVLIGTCEVLEVKEA
jgi:hypothetical protein